MGVTEDVTGTLRAEQHGHQPVVYGISSYDSNAMKSSNPHSGVYEAETARTLDNNGGSPACNQGGMAVVSIDEKMGQTCIGEEVGNTLCARDYKGVGSQYVDEGKCIVSSLSENQSSS